ncbi:MAG TPA: HlyD family efflux transporter periplasmic adaptor subunit [Ktedonobacterales bacterium]|nr:HlyD family efflux transporter periplasmic adaptor subunit [Ktedonobacterales bacterium]
MGGDPHDPDILVARYGETPAAQFRPLPSASIRFRPIAPDCARASQRQETTVDEPTIPAATLGRTERLRTTLRRSLPLRILLIVLLVALVGAALYLGIFGARQPRPTFATVHKGNVTISLQTTGTIQATIYQADFPVDGTLAAIDVTVGQQVKQGATLATLNVAPYQSALTAAQTTADTTQQAISAAQGAQSDAQTAVGAAASSLDEQQSYAQEQCAVAPNGSACGAATAAVARAQAQLASARAQASAAQAQMALAQRAVSASDSALATAQAQLAAATLVAPHSGVVTVINGAVGGKPGATATGMASFITIADTGAPLVTALVNYQQIGAIQAGEAATFQAPQASSSATFKGTVTGVELLPHGEGATLSYPVALKIDPASLGHVTPLPGMNAQVRIITHARYNVLVIAQSAVQYAHSAAPPDGSGVLSKSQIHAALTSAQALEQSTLATGFDARADPLTATYLVGFARGHYVAIPVVLGLSDGRQTEVVAGLDSGQQVVSGQRSLLFG